MARKDPDPNDPNPLQPRRREAMAAMYQNKSENDLKADQQHIVQGALEAGRHVFLVGTRASIATYEKQFFPNDVYDLRVVARWVDQIDPQFGDTDPPKDEPGRNNRRGFGQGRGPGGPGGPPRGGFDQWTSSAWVMVEASLHVKLPATKPVEK